MLGLANRVCWPDGHRASFAQDNLALIAYVMGVVMLTAATILGILTFAGLLDWWEFWIAAWLAGLALDFLARYRLRIVTKTVTAKRVIPFDMKERLCYNEFAVRYLMYQVTKLELKAENAKHYKERKELLRRARTEEKHLETMRTKLHYVHHQFKSQGLAPENQHGGMFYSVSQFAARGNDRRNKKYLKRAESCAKRCDNKLATKYLERAERERAWASISRLEGTVDTSIPIEEADENGTPINEWLLDHEAHHAARHHNSFTNFLDADMF